MKYTVMALALATAACGGTMAEDPSPPAPVTSTAPANQTQSGGALIPAGYGTLHQDQFTVSLRSGPLLVKLTPLSEAVIRLAAPDTYNRLHSLAESRTTEFTSLSQPGLFLVSFFSYQPEVTFQPEDVQLTHQGRLLRPSRIVPITSGWGRQRMGQQETQMAVFGFEGPFDYEQPITVHYGMEQSAAWESIRNVLEVERGKVRARAQS